MALKAPLVAAGLAVAVIALLTMTWLAGREQQADANAQPASTEQPLTTTSMPPADTIVTTDPPVIEGLTESVVRVLVVNGYAIEEATDELPDSVVKVLAERGIALTIAEEG